MAGIVWERAQDGCSSPILSSQLSRASLGRTYWHVSIQPAVPANQGPLLKLVLCRNCDPHNLNRALRFHAHNHPGCTSCLLLNVLPTHTDKFSPSHTICDNFLPHRQKVRHREMRSHHRAGTLAEMEIHECFKSAFSTPSARLSEGKESSTLWTR